MEGIAPRWGRWNGHGSRLVKKLLLGMVVLALLAPAVAAARDLRPGFGPRMQEPGGRQTNKTAGQPSRGERDPRGEHFKGNKGRLTEEERRELHRDLDRANREIYKR